MIYPQYDPTGLFAGEKQPVQRPVTLAAGQNPPAGIPQPGQQPGPGTGIPEPLPRGTLLGRSATGSASAAPKAGGNTGNGTLTMDPSTPVLTGALPGTYAVAFTSATAFTVTDPNGNAVGTGGTVGTAFANEIKFNTAAGSTAFAAGDQFNITVMPADEYVVCKAGATDGSQVPVAVLAFAADTSGGPVVAPAYFDGEFAGEMMALDPSWTIQTLQATLRRAQSPLYVRSVGVLG